ncbi:MAG: thioredoxin-dependent thiol peroxidase [Candidatus Omnitrophica bacterium]|nr:thioredoxin-dependent thiol peroxidase [Candidatus Omnitrophota bacterium]
MSTSDAVSPALSIGQPTPDLPLQDDQGRTVRLADFRGKTVVLYFYPKDDTPGCTKEACGFRDRLDRVARAGAVVLGVSADSVASHQRFKAKYGLTFPLLSDPEKRLAEAYGVWKRKSLYGRTFLGIERTTVIIDATGRVAKIFPRVKVEGHVDQVLDAIESLRAANERRTG